MNSSRCLSVLQELLNITFSLFSYCETVIQPFGQYDSTVAMLRRYKSSLDVLQIQYHVRSYYVASSNYKNRNVFLQPRPTRSVPNVSLSSSSSSLIQIQFQCWVPPGLTDHLMYSYFATGSQTLCTMYYFAQSGWPDDLNVLASQDTPFEYMFALPGSLGITQDEESQIAQGSLELIVSDVSEEEHGN